MRQFENLIIEHFLPAGKQGTTEQLKLEVLEVDKKRGAPLLGSGVARAGGSKK